ncbi:ankyrin repeat and SOCS box protein 11 [Xiphophorus hellerii]|uniref:ankyrin repeat and SOCS box protein 11 n=1 Tax=Xiphophorus hellerii TaxID=8084 RepID=UPI0013B38230|nr:ankyrin repeat and SOCS box protein 9-like [Xiphophorus hellerii]
MMATISTRSQPFQNRLYIYKGLPCNSLMADTCSDRTPLHEAAYQGRLLHLMTLIAQGFQVNTLTLDGVSPLHEACLTGRYACAKVLLDNGANAQAVSADGATPLFNSCSSGNIACVRLLLQHGASVHTDHQLASPIHQAAKNGHRECLELLLLSSGAQIDFEIPGVGTPLYAACRAPAAECVELLLRSGADVGSGCGQISPLHAAVCAGEADIVKFLLDFGADGASRNAEGKTPLDLSAPDSAVRFALERRAPCSLSELCRFCIRRSLGRPRLHRTSSLFLPHSIKNFLLHK